jgi:hypothetical protein
MFYPNLTYESTNGFHDAIGASEKFSGFSGIATVKGNFDVGGTGSGTVTLYNENTNAQAMLINGNLTIRTGSTLNNGAATNGTGFEVKGNITADGMFNVNGNSLGTLTLSGSAIQTIAGSNAIADNMNVQNCIMNNTVGITENKDFNIFGTHTFAANAKLDFGTGNIALKSTPTKTANLASFPASAVISYTGAGRFIVERYLFGKKAWRLLATPIDPTSSPSIYNSWQESGSLVSNGFGTQVSGPAGGTGLDYNTVRGSLKWFKGADQNYVEITNTNDLLARSEGYYVFVRGDRASALSGTGTATNLRIKGKINIGTQPVFPVTNFATFGNPYPSAIDFRNVSKTNIADAFIVWNPNNAGVYNVGAFETYSYNGSDYVRTPGGDIRDTIQSGEAVFIQSIGGGSITLEENDKVGGSRNVSRGGNSQSRIDATTPTLDINLFAKEVNGNMYLADGVKLNFDIIFSNGIDNDDVRKIMNNADNLYINNGNTKLVVERRNILQNTDTIFLHLTGTRVAPYRFQLKPSQLINTGLDAFLKDKFLKTETAISFIELTEVNFDITSDPASRVADRFMIVFKNALPFTTIIALNAFTNADKTNAILWKVNNENNVAYYSIERSSNAIDFIGIKNNAALQNNNTTVAYSNVDDQPVPNDNFYRIKMTLLNGNYVYSHVVKVGKINNEVDIAILPNPIKNKTIHLQMANQPKGLYNLRLINDIGQTMYKTKVTINSYLQIQDIVLPKNTAVGNYTLVLVNNLGEKIVKEIAIVE